MSKRALWLQVYAIHTHHDRTPEEARSLADAAVKAAPRSFWDWFR